MPLPLRAGREMMRGVQSHQRRGVAGAPCSCRLRTFCSSAKTARIRSSIVRTAARGASDSTAFATVAANAACRAWMDRALDDRRHRPRASQPLDTNKRTHNAAELLAGLLNPTKGRNGSAESKQNIGPNNGAEGAEGRLAWADHRLALC